MRILVHSQQKEAEINESVLKSAVEIVLQEEGVVCDEVGVSFVTEVESGRLHGEHFDDPSPTDCMSFPCDPDTESHYRVLGDIVICPRVAQQYAKAHDLSPEKELLRYLIHGLLHLIGYDDIQETEYEGMKRLEERYLALLEKRLESKPPFAIFHGCFSQ